MERNGKSGGDGESLFFLPGHQDTGPGHFLNKEAEHRQAGENYLVMCLVIPLLKRRKHKIPGSQNGPIYRSASTAREVRS